MSILGINRIVMLLGIVLLVFTGYHFNQLSVAMKIMDINVLKIGQLNSEIHELMVLTNETIQFDKVTTHKKWLKKHEGLSSEIIGFMRDLSSEHQRSVQYVYQRHQNIQYVYLDFIKVKRDILTQKPGRHYFKIQGANLFSLSSELYRRMVLLQQDMVGQMTRLSNKINLHIFYFLGLVVLFLVSSYLFIIKRILFPISKISTLLPTFATGNIHEPIQWKHTDEIGTFVDLFNETIQKRQEWENDLISIRQEHTFKQLFNSLDSFISIVDKSFHYIVVNQKFLRTFKKNEEDIVGYHIQEVLGENHFEVLKEHFEKAFNGKTVMVHNSVSIDGSNLINIESVFSPFYDDNLNISGVIVHARDITETKRLETALAEKEHMLMQQSRLADMGQMLSAIAHQWRQPLNNIHLIAQLIQKKDDENEKDKLYSMHADLVDYMSKTIDDFRNFFSSKDENRNFNVIEEVQKALDLFSAQLKNHSIQYGVTHNELAYDTYEMIGQDRKLRQVFLNLISNAKDAMLDASKSIDYEKIIQINVMSSEDKVHIIFKNTGSSISQEVMPKIFDPYFTTKDEGEGTGLGLYMSKLIVEKEMKGELFATNVDDGVEFHILLPNSSGSNF